MKNYNRFDRFIIKTSAVIIGVPLLLVLVTASYLWITYTIDELRPHYSLDIKPVDGTAVSAAGVTYCTKSIDNPSPILTIDETGRIDEITLEFNHNEYIKKEVGLFLLGDEPIAYIHAVKSEGNDPVTLFYRLCPSIGAFADNKDFLEAPQIIDYIELDYLGSGYTFEQTINTGFSSSVHINIDNEEISIQESSGGRVYYRDCIYNINTEEIKRRSYDKRFVFNKQAMQYYIVNPSEIIIANQNGEKSTIPHEVINDKNFTDIYITKSYIVLCGQQSGYYNKLPDILKSRNIVAERIERASLCRLHLQLPDKTVLLSADDEAVYYYDSANKSVYAFLWDGGIRLISDEPFTENKSYSVTYEGRYIIIYCSDEPIRIIDTKNTTE